MHRTSLRRIAVLCCTCALALGALWAAESGAQAVSKAVQYLVRIYALDPPLDIIGGVETEPVRTGRLEPIDGGFVSVPRLDAGTVATGLVANPDAGPVVVVNGVSTPAWVVPDAGFAGLTGRGIDLQSFPGGSSCSPTSSLMASSTMLPPFGDIIYCDELGIPHPLGTADAMPYYTAPAGLGNQGPPNERVFGTTPPTTVTRVRALRITGAISNQGSGGAATAYITLRQRFEDGGFQELCRLPVPCDGPLADGRIDAGFYQATCSGIIEPGTPGYLAYSSDGGCSANPYVQGSLVYLLQASQ